MKNEFLDFLKKFAVIGTAIGITAGSAVKSLVDSLSSNIISPLVGLFLGKVNLSDLTFNLNNSVFKYGQFISDLITFLVIMVIVFLLIKFFVAKFLGDADIAKASA